MGLLMFFSNEDNTKVIGTFLRKADATLIEDEVRKNRLEISREIIGYIYKNPEEWDEKCSFNIKHIGDQFLQWLRDFDPSKPTHIDYIYSSSYRFLCEFDFLVGAGRELSIELRSIQRKIQHDDADIDDDVRSQIIYASYVMPANIAKEFINDANIGIFRNFEQKKAEAENLKDQWDKELNSKKAETDRLKDKLDEYKIAFNFVGLYQGFSELAKKKTKESFLLFLSLLVMGILILSPLIAEIALAYKKDNLGLDHLFVLIPIISIEVILIYFFRVILLNHQSVKAQIMQIELRQTLCQFIQSYADYSKKNQRKRCCSTGKV
jgi:hypothetical protein